MRFKTYAYFSDISKAEKEFEFNRLKKYFKDLSSSLKFV